MQVVENQSVTIHVKFTIDEDSIYMTYYDLKRERERYQERGFSESMAKWYNRRNEDIMEKLDNGSLLMLDMSATAFIKMPCGHNEEISDSLGGVEYDTWKDNIENMAEQDDYYVVSNVKDMIKEKLGTENIGFQLDVDTEIRYN